MGFMDGVKRLFGISAAPGYDLERAVVVVFASLPEAEKQSLDHDDIELVLKLALRYAEEQGLMDGRQPPPGAGAPKIDQQARAEYVQQKARMREKDLALEHIQAVFEAEQVYMRKLGLID